VLANPFAEYGVRLVWQTWSVETRQILHRLAESAPKLPEPQLVRFGSGEYEYSLDIDLATCLRPALWRQVKQVVRALYELKPRAGIVLFDRLFDSRIDGKVLRLLLAAARNELVKMAGDSRAAIYAPLGASGGAEQGDFPIHADLYRPVILWNIFDNVPADGSGASLFLRATTLLQAVRDSSGIPKDVKKRIRELLRGPIRSDSYEEFWDLIHGAHPWVTRLERIIKREQLVFGLGRGQGYMVHDRLWLHGRQAPRTKVGRDRLHRLIFDTRSTREGSASARFRTGHRG
jgi:hypothetical protein